MRKPGPGSVAAATTSPLTGRGEETPARLVCLALALALAVLATRIVSVW
jgi:hypothetical protein